MMKRSILVVAVSLATTLTLAGCMTREERIAAQNAKDDQKCLAYGARRGTDAYVACRAQLDSARTTAEAIEDAAPTPTPNPIPGTDAPALRPMTIPCPPYSRAC
jgi:hypothetical protein